MLLNEEKVRTATRAQLQILEIVKSVSKIAKDGVKFFDLLDERIKESPSYYMLMELFSLVPQDYVLILSGGFGKMIANMIDGHKYSSLNKPYLLYEGGIRSGASVKFIRGTDKYMSSLNFLSDDIDQSKIKKCFFLDDSIYGGKTFYVLRDYLKSIGITMDEAGIIYDGCPIKKLPGEHGESIYSVFRYYDFYDATPNFSHKSFNDVSNIKASGNTPTED